ncbi:MAG: ferritin-like domain-containing protein [Rhodospirillaceae bacterium]|jgi:hypothetical protein|nr:ferritin-like domain-containing protein [Rhodospirillales bacterium]MBT3907895.1 ferritin-like domain-containing protein [Rhodospirillaceae bacterium]MBT4703315.1 ferritin-like domain-containing protein [Rhodospirillaceae bacterium]MBT5035670.1 ferritin-like domain-containing protein [Rhodospirillaceae bacterium]MBT6218673.1 ferritin-like domain-containing protein [Rhodospirillaceae bacterium]
MTLTEEKPIPDESPLKGWTSDHEGELRIGSEEHKQMFCRMLLDTYDPYKPAVIDWPELEGDALARLTGLPFWQIAVETESETSMRMQCAADATKDPLIKEAISLNAFEERRHKDVLENMIRFYGIKLKPEPDYPTPTKPNWAFTQTGYGECFDSFFAFGLFKVARDSGFFPEELVEVFEPVIQEEARHILFFVNWLAYQGTQQPLVMRPYFHLTRFYAVWKKARNRLKLARSKTNNSNMTLKGHKAMGIKLTPASFMDLCLSENDRRMDCFDSRLLRPKFMPSVVKMSRRFIHD